MLTKQEILLGKCVLAESTWVREPRRTTLPRGSQFYGDGISFQVVFSQSFGLRVLPGGTCLVQPRWMPVRRILGSGWTCGISFWPFPNSSGWWWLISFMFLAGPPVVKQLLQMLLWCLARVGGFSQCASPNNSAFPFHMAPHPFLPSPPCPQLLPLGYALHTLLSAIPVPLQWQRYSSVWTSLAWPSMLITSDML